MNDQHKNDQFIKQYFGQRGGDVNNDDQGNNDDNNGGLDFGKVIGDMLPLALEFI